MHLNGLPSFEFFPGESVVMPTNEEMIIDFPIANETNPTQCLALGIDGDKISEVAQKFNIITSYKNETTNWEISKDAAHLMNNQDINILIKRLVEVFVDNKKSKDILLDLMIQELIVRLLQTKAKERILNDTTGVFNDTRIGTVIRFIKENLTNKDISVDVLADKAYMSTSHFYRQFKNTLGVSPIDYLNSEKIKFAKKMMKKNDKMLISEIAFKSGFNNISYFNRQFKKTEMMTPQQFKKSILY